MRFVGVNAVAAAAAGADGGAVKVAVADGVDAVAAVACDSDGVVVADSCCAC